MEKTWVFGKVHPGWYVAMNGWQDNYAKHLESLGYKVRRSVEKPVK
jgi:hypothetical protein